MKLPGTVSIKDADMSCGSFSFFNFSKEIFRSLSMYVHI